MRRPGNPSAISMAGMAAKSEKKEEQRCAKYKVFKAIDDAYRKGDIDALLAALGPADFPNSPHPWELGLGDFPLEYAIYGVRWGSFERFSTMGPIRTIRTELVSLR